MDIGRLLIILGVVSILIGAFFGRRATRRHFGEITQRTLDSAQMLGLTPAMAVFRGVGWLLILAGIGVLVIG